MEIQQLRYLVLLAQEKHFSRAAKKANVTQPTLSQQIKKLEDELGTPLFERSPQQVSLTKAGKKFIPHAMSVLDQLKQGMREIQDNPDSITGTIRMGAIPTICPYVLPEVISTLSREAPKLKLEIYEETTSVLIDHLKSGFLDLGILSPPILDKGISTLTIHEEPFLLAVPKKHSLAKKDKVSLEDIASEKILILKEGHCFGQQAMEFCRLKRSDSQVSFQGSSLTSVIALTQSGKGITFVPQIAVKQEYYSSLKFLTLHGQAFREIGMAWRLTLPLDKASQFLMTLIKNVIKTMSKKEAIH